MNACTGDGATAEREALQQRAADTIIDALSATRPTFTRAVVCERCLRVCEPTPDHRCLSAAEEIVRLAAMLAPKERLRVAVELIESTMAKPAG